MPAARLASLTAALLLCCAASSTPAQTIAPAHAIERGQDASPQAWAALDRMVASGAPGVTMVVARRGRELSRVHAGSIDSTTQLPIASASKWLVAATIMRLVDEGKVSLDAPVSRYLPHLTGAAGTITLRQALAQTTGIAWTIADLRDLKQDARITLRQSTDDILARPLAYPPGSRFQYGGPGFQIVGAVAEAVTGQRWEEVFQSRIARPLGMKRTYWAHLSFDPGPWVPAEETLNPVLQGGAVSTVDDYMALLTMLVQNGRYQGRRVLSAKSIAEMHRNQTLNADMGPPDAVLPEAGYGLGNWCETWDAQASCTRVSSLGAFGTYPWIDKASGLYGITFMRHDMFKVWGDLKAAQAAAIAGARRR